MRDKPMTDAEYVEASGCRCPACGSDEIESTAGVEVDGGYASQEVGCLACPAVWYDTYILTGFDDLDPTP
tara:strand:- start:837 stop:1046 length:210 start_codon:yes stop_codon:yes gene_type:complete